MLISGCYQQQDPAFSPADSAPLLRLMPACAQQGVALHGQAALPLLPQPLLRRWSRLLVVEEAAMEADIVRWEGVASMPQ